jgi:CheY-like chemotaxis protein
MGKFRSRACSMQQQPPGIYYQGIHMSSNASALSGLKVLIVDDAPDILAVTKLILTNYLAQVITATTGAEGLKQVQAHKPDVIVSDIGMPQMDGYQFIREVRNLPADNGGRTPAIALTAFTRREDRAKAFAAGFQKHLSKPVDLHALIETIASISAR